MSHQVALNILAVVLFLVGLVLLFAMNPADMQLIWALLLGGLASHSASHLPV